MLFNAERGQFMSAAESFESSGNGKWGLEYDLASLASHAAVELDNLILGRAERLDAVSYLARVILGSFASASKSAMRIPTFDPATAVVMRHAIVDSEMAGPELTTINDLSKLAGRIRVNLERLGKDPESFRRQDQEQLKRMRSFCVALSRRASALDQSVDDIEQTHPFRR